MMIVFTIDLKTPIKLMLPIDLPNLKINLVFEPAIVKLVYHRTRKAIFHSVHL